MSNGLKWKLAVAFLLVFAAGFMSGSFLGARHAFRIHLLRPPHSGAVAERMREHLRRELDLTPEQLLKVGPIVEASSAEIENIRAETAERVRTTMEKSGNQISPHLTPEQRKKMAALREKHHKALRHHGFGPPRPPHSHGPPP